MASIFKTDAGTYRVKVSIPVNGKYKQKTKSGFKNKTEAKAWATQIEAHKFENDKPKYSNDTLQEYFDSRVMNSSNNSESDIRQAVIDDLSRFLFKETARKPMIMPMLILV
ncbi:Arm DNA-binding domain-containing protein [Leuconostoc mesenteroides]|nr:Arm DNA-binding domain-containing protein [Leuconostoc mesenteroides]MCM6837711.1 Arm DNA-binding domain-containing protein [Leuconostoc mesenteroides]